MTTILRGSWRGRWRRCAVGAVVGSALACPLLTACDDDGSSTPTRGASEPVLTVPGTTLGIGETATVPIGDGVARLTVDRIEAGTRRELSSFDARADATVSYVWITVEPVSGDVSAFATYDHIHGWVGSDLVPHVVTDPQTYPPCPTRYFPASDAVDPLETCTVFTSERPIDHVGFHDDSAYRRNAEEILWR